MPLKVRSFCTSVLLVLVSFFAVNAQTSADVMRGRVSKAKAYIAVRNYNAAIYELENIRRETSDPTVNGVINVLLMNSYLEQGDYTRAQDFLKELSNTQKINRQGGSANYFAVAGQVVKGARNQLERYRALGLSVSDRGLPIEASVDIEKMRETLEAVVDQSKTLIKDKDKTSDAMALLDEATNVRSTLAKDDYDATRWKNETADAREAMVNSRSVVVNAVGGQPATDPNKPDQITTAATLPNVNNPNLTAEVKPNTANLTLQPVPTDASVKPAANTAPNIEPKPSTETIVGKTEAAQPLTGGQTQPTVRERRFENAKAEKTPNVNKPEPTAEKTPNVSKSETTAETTDASKSTLPLAVGSLVEYATQRTNPVYPVTARTMRMTGIVRIEVVIDENGQVSEVQNTSGPSLLRGAASDAVRKWKFKPFVRDGEPVKATGFVNFNFTL